MWFKSKLFFLFIAPFLALVSGCATVYQKEGVFANGYSDFRSGQDQFVVTFRANEHTQPEKVMEYALKRASHLTLKNGYRYFTIVDEFDTSKKYKGTKKSPYLHYPSIRLTIQCFHEKPTELTVIDAHSFLHQPKN